jgi:general secretion pathway protein C
MATKPKWSDFLSRDSSRTLAAANGLLPAWVSLAIVVLIGWQLAKIIWMFVPGTGAGEPVLVPIGQRPAATSNDSASVTSIARVHIFGEADADDEPVADLLVTEELPDTNIRSLVLKGTYTAEIPDMSFAIITDGNNDEKVFAIGDPVASGATLHAVHVDRVVLNERGELTSLSLPRDYAQSASRTVRRSQPTRQTNTQSIQAVVAQNVSRLADVIRPTPFFQNGQQQGYRVYPGRDRRQFAALGLRPGDLIKQIDGQSLTDPTQAMQIFQSLGTASEVTVTVERNGTQQTLVLRTEQLDIGRNQTE